MHSNFLTYLTAPTLDIAKLLWFDTLKIAGMEGMQASFSEEEIHRTEKFSFPMHYKRKVQIAEKIGLEFFDAGHILGSSMVKLYYKKKNVLYTGDFKTLETRLFNGADLKVGNVDIVIIESTYGDRNQVPRKQAEKQFIELVQDTVDKGGWALVPAFAVGRRQEIIDILNEYKIDVPIYFDGMGQKAARISLNYPDYLKNPKFLEKALSKVSWIKHRGMRKTALKNPSVIVTTSGMMQGGPVNVYLPKIIKNKNSCICLTGFQVEGTPGRKLLESNKIKVEGTIVEAKAIVKKFEFSAHPDKTEMLKALKKWSPEKVLCIHGEKQVCHSFAKTIKEELGINAIAPEQGKTLAL